MTASGSRKQIISFSNLDLREGGSIATAIFSSDIEISGCLI